MAKVGSSLTLVTKLTVVATFDMLVEGKESAMVVEKEALSTAEAASTEWESVSSETSADRIFDGVAESRPSFLAAEAASNVVTEGVVFVVDCEVTERPGEMQSVEATVRATGASVGVVVPATVDGKLLVVNLARASASSGTEGTLLSSTSSEDI